MDYLNDDKSRRQGMIKKLGKKVDKDMRSKKKEIARKMKGGEGHDHWSQIKGKLGKTFTGKNEGEHNMLGKDGDNRS